MAVPEVSTCNQSDIAVCAGARARRVDCHFARQDNGAAACGRACIGDHLYIAAITGGARAGRSYRRLTAALPPFLPVKIDDAAGGAAPVGRDDRSRRTVAHHIGPGYNGQIAAVAAEP